MSILKEIGHRIERILNPSVSLSIDKPQLTEDIAQQMRDETEYGPMYLPDDVKRQLKKRNTDQRSTKQHG